jgi:para-nitrobenzyl esterase
MFTNTHDARYAAAMIAAFGPNLGDAVVHQYPASRFNATKDGSAAWWAEATAWGDAFMTCAAQLTARQLATAPGRKSGVWRYFFNHELDLLKTLDIVQKHHAYGCCHASEIPLVFGLDAVLASDAERAMSARVVEYWEAFAANGTPGESWPAWEPSTNATLVWDVVDGKASFTVSSTLKESDCAFWESHYDEITPSVLHGGCAK